MYKTYIINRSPLLIHPVEVEQPNLNAMLSTSTVAALLVSVCLAASGSQMTPPRVTLISISEFGGRESLISPLVFPVFGTIFSSSRSHHVGVPHLIQNLSFKDHGPASEGFFG